VGANTATRTISSGHHGRAWLALGALLAVAAACGEHEGAGEIEGAKLPGAVVQKRAGAERARAAWLAGRSSVPAPDKQILFGDLHVHTTFSADAFMMSLPIFQGEGPNPVAQACDYARYCSGLDFWSINDHAEGLTPERWAETKETIRQCNAVAGDPTNPDVVAFLGWEWTQIGQTPKDHYGHKNVIVRALDDDAVPPRPIHAASFAAAAMRERPPLSQRMLLPLADFENRQRYFNLATYQEELRDVEPCPEGVDTRELPEDCSEGATSPEVLFEKLAQWGGDSLVIPHGTTWGIYTPPGSAWDKQLSAVQHDPERQRLIEVFSGHGNSEEYRAWRPVEHLPDGSVRCPEPRDGYEPCCWRAGEIIRSRCEDPTSAACEENVRRARQLHAEAGVNGRLTVPGATVEDWRGCETCTDCYLPSFRPQPTSSMQYILALGDAGAPRELRRFHFGVIASSDNHSARPGTGYKEYGRLLNTEARGAKDEEWERRINPLLDEPRAAAPRAAASVEVPAFAQLDFERQASFFLTGGLVAVHSLGRSRDEIWDALRRREVYGTSGDRILLWFDLLNGPVGKVPMGGETIVAEAPRFRVRAAGAFEQLPGCPPVSLSGLSSERLDWLCRGECYHPSDTRRRIEKIEVIRIRPRVDPREPMEALIEDPWRSYDCPASTEGCVVEFDDPELPESGREHLYYVRAVQEATLAVNAGLERCQYDDEGHCVALNPCYGDYRTKPDDDCLAASRERAWSSPIWVTPAGG